MSTRHCGACGSTLGADARFCGGCGMQQPPQLPGARVPPVPGGPSLSVPVAPAASRGTRTALIAGAVAILAAGGGFAAVSLAGGGNEDVSGAHGQRPVAASTVDDAPAEAAVTTPADEALTTPVEPDAPAESDTPPLEPDDATSSLTEFYGELGNGRFATAWRLQSEHYRTWKLDEPGYSDGTLDDPPRKWIRTYRDVQRYLDVSGMAVEVVEYDDAGTEALVDVQGTDYGAPQSDSACYTGRTWFVFESGEWRYEPGYGPRSHRDEYYREHRQDRGELLGWTCS